MKSPSPSGAISPGGTPDPVELAFLLPLGHLGAGLKALGGDLGELGGMLAQVGRHLAELLRARRPVQGHALNDDHPVLPDHGSGDRPLGLAEFRFSADLNHAGLPLGGLAFVAYHGGSSQRGPGYVSPGMSQ